MTTLAWAVMVIIILVAALAVDHLITPKGD